MGDLSQINLGDIYPLDPLEEEDGEDERSETTIGSEDDFSTVPSGQGEENSQEDNDSDMDKKLFSKRDLMKIF